MQATDSMRVAFVTNFVPHYRVKMFEALASMCDLRCFLYSDGGEWYWQRAHGVQRGDFAFEYLPGFWLGRVRIAPRLPGELLGGRYDVYIKCINDRFAVPVTFLAARLRRAPFILWTGVWRRLDTPLHRLIFPVTRFLYRHSDAIVAYGEHVRQYLIGEGVDPRRIFLAPQAVDNAHYGRAVPNEERKALRARLDISEDSRIVLYLGRLEPVKGVEYLLRAFAASRREGVALVLCGAGSLESELRALASELGIDARVRFAGYVPPAEAVCYYSAAWAVVLPSVTVPAGRETWGLVANEAFNQGVPMIATQAVGAVAGGLVRHNRNGLVTPERDVAALSAALDRILGEPGLRDELGRHARQDVLSWTQQRMAEGFRDAATFALGRRRRGAS
jgi:glycosyltransferase involved in cell wall biosynthesis